MLLPSSWSPKLRLAVSDGLPESKERAGSAGVLKNPPAVPAVPALSIPRRPALMPAPMPAVLALPIMTPTKHTGP